jgi:hypothetical protein
MKAFVIFSALALAGCGGSGASGTGTQVLASQGGSAASWSRVESATACEAMVPSYCVGAYGFAIDAQGTYTAGGLAGSKQVTGQITADELKQLDADLRTIALDIGHSAVPDCRSAGSAVPGSGDHVSITLATGGTAYPLRQNAQATVGLQECSYNGDLQAPLHALTTFGALRQKYYPVPFPG